MNEKEVHSQLFNAKSVLLVKKNAVESLCNISVGEILQCLPRCCIPPHIWPLIRFRVWVWWIFLFDVVWLFSCAQQVLDEQRTEVQLQCALRPELLHRAWCYIWFCSGGKLFCSRNFCSKRFIQYTGVGPALGIVYGTFAFLTMYQSIASSTRQHCCHTSLL